MDNFRVLIVDDFEMVRKMVKDSLSRIGIQRFDEAEDGVVALNKLREGIAAGSPFNLMLLDLNMPNLNGLEVLAEIQKDSSLKGLCTLVVSAEAERSFVTEAIRRGALDYIIKPFSTDVMKSKLERIAAAQRKKPGA